MNSKSFTLVSILMILFLMPTIAESADVNITDSSGELIALKNVKIDYTKYPTSFGFYKTDYEHKGIRIHRGSGITTVIWKKIANVEISEGYKVTITLTSGKNYEVTLMSSSKKGLFGETDLGNYEIPLASVKKIEVTKP
jgi:hypothetical protein